jgi:hypothetical protein
MNDTERGLSAKSLDTNGDKITRSNTWLALRDDIERRTQMERSDRMDSELENQRRGSE